LVSNKAEKLYALEKSKLEFEGKMISNGYIEVKNISKNLNKDEVVSIIANSIVNGVSKLNNTQHYTVVTIKDYKISTNQIIRNTKDKATKISHIVIDLSNYVKGEVGQSINNVRSSLNPMKTW